MKIRIVSAAILATLALAAMPAHAQEAAPAKKKKVAAKNATELVLINNRGAAVTGFQLTSAAGKNAATLKNVLEPGKKVTLKIAKGAGCVFSANAAFSDDAEFDQTEVDLCKDKTIKFVD